MRPCLQVWNKGTLIVWVDPYSGEEHTEVRKLKLGALPAARKKELNSLTFKSKVVKLCVKEGKSLIKQGRIVQLSKELQSYSKQQPPLLTAAPQQGGVVVGVEKAQNLVQNVKDFLQANFFRRFAAKSRHNKGEGLLRMEGGLLLGIALLTLRRNTGMLQYNSVATLLY